MIDNVMKPRPQDMEPIDVEAREIKELQTPGEDEDDDDDIEELPDGSAIVKKKAKKAKKKSNNFDDNLAESMEESDLDRLGMDTCERIKSDKESRKKRDEQYAEGIRRAGVGGDAPGGAEFDGASKVVHPMLAKGCVDFASKAIKELFPASGPCKTQIIGKQTDEKLSRAERKKTYVNWQLMTQVSENRAEFERLLSQLPLGGSQYKRWWRDPMLRRNRTETVFIDDVFLPYQPGINFYNAPRVTHRQYISKETLQERVDSGLYRDIVVSAPAGGSLPDKSDAQDASEHVEGVEEDHGAYNDEGLREVYMTYADMDIEEDGVHPYILHIESYGHKVLGIYRNWKEDDETYAKKHWMVEYTFIPWRGPYGIGLTHLIGSLAAASTGALRALLDSAHIQNFPGAVKLKSGRTAGQNVPVNPTQIAEIDAPAGVTDIRQLLMAFPFNGPSTVLQTLLEWLTGQAEQSIAVASDKIADASSNMPMGTALALIEQGSVNFSAIHARLHDSLKKELEIVHRLNAEYMDDSETVEDLGELVVSRKDFIGPTDIIPVSDPNIFSESQRYAQMQAVLQLSTDPRFAPMFPPDKLLRRALKLLQVSDVEDITMLPKDPEKLSATDENYVTCGQEPQPLKVYDGQDHLSHLQNHVHFMTSPMTGGNPLIAPQAIPALLAHSKDHIMGFYKQHTKAAAQALLTVARHANLGPMTEDQAEAHGAAFADQLMSQALGPLVMPGLQKAQQMMQQLTPPPQADPNTQLTEQTKLKMKQMEIDADNQRSAQQQQSTQAAAAMAAQQEQAATQSKESIASMIEHGKQLAMVLQSHLDEVAEIQKAEREQSSESRNTELQQMLQLMKDQGAQQLIVLQAMLGSIMPSSQPAGGGTADGGGSEGAAPAQPRLQIMGTQEVIAQLVTSMADNNKMLMQRLGETTAATTQMLGQLGQLTQGMQALHAAQTAPRMAELIRDQRGKATGIRTVPQIGNGAQQ